MAPQASAQAAAATPPVPVAPMPLADADEGEERDEMSDEAVAAVIASKTTGAGFRDATAALSWSDYADFNAFIASLKLHNFSADEFLVLGGSHSTARRRLSWQEQLSAETHLAKYREYGEGA